MWRARPNTNIHYELFTPHTDAMPTLQLKPDAWWELGKEYPEKEVVHAIVGMARFGARIGFGGSREGQHISKNLATADELPDILNEDIQEQKRNDRLIAYRSHRAIPKCFYSSPLGLVDKPNGKKRRIHHLSHPVGASINDGIAKRFGEISYTTVGEVVAAILELGVETVMLKRDFADAFRQVPVCPQDTPLLGFSFQGHFYAERFLPFGLRTAPYLFNLFAEVFHWALERRIQAISPTAKVLHYLDDFIVLLPPGSRWEPAAGVFQETADEVGLKIKEQKNEEGTLVSFGGLLIDTRRMIIRLPPEKKTKGLALVSKYENAESVSLFDLQQLTGFLNFITAVVPLGRAFLRRLYNLQLFFPAARFALRRISAEAQRDLSWWRNLLSSTGDIERVFMPQARKNFAMWTDAAGLKGLGGYFIANPDKCGTAAHHPGLIQPEEAFMVALPRHIDQRQEHINTKEMRAVEQGILRWRHIWRGARVSLYIDNRAVVHGIANQSIRGNTMQVLRRCLLVASRSDIELVPAWIPTGENELADALSRFNKVKITDLAPQLLPLFNHLSHGFLTLGVRECPE